jgi:hypothetical protein
MALTTYTELKAAVADNAHRTDLTTQIMDCVTLCEARLFDMLLLRNGEVESNLTSTAGVNYIALPAGYISPIALWLTSNSIRELLTPALPQDLPYDPNNNRPQYWSIDGDNVRFDCPFDAVYTLPFRYVKTVALSGSVASNEVLARRPDIYLSGTLAELARYMGNQALFTIWENRFVQAVAEMKAAESRARSMVPLRVDPALSARSGTFDIYRGT